MKIALGLSVLAVALTASLLPAFAGGSGGSSSDEEAPPITTITAGPAGPTNITSAEFVFTADQQEPRFFCALDSPNYSPCASPLTYSGIGDGQHTFYVYVGRDKQHRAPATWSWVVDTAPPAPVAGVHARVAYGKLQLSWTPSGDTDHVVIFRSVGAQKGSKQVYAGAGTTYAEAKFVNAVEHRYGFVSYDKAGNVSPPTGMTVKKSALLLTPADGAMVRRAHPPALRWRAVRGASFYNVQLWRASHKVLSAWPHHASSPLSRAWRYENRRYHLEPGLYTWFVWPGFGPLQKGIYGELVGTATFRVR
jgi:hypothetical protein